MNRPFLPNLTAGYQIIFDNLNIGKHAHAKSTKRNQHLDLVHAYCILDDVNVEHLDNTGPKADILNIPNSQFLLSKKEHSEIREQFKVLVQRAMAEHIPFFKINCSDYVIHHIPHPYQDQMARKSTIVSVN